MKYIIIEAATENISKHFNIENLLLALVYLFLSNYAVNKRWIIFRNPFLFNTTHFDSVLFAFIKFEFFLKITFFSKTTNTTKLCFADNFV